MENQEIFAAKEQGRKLLDQGKLASALPLLRQAAYWGDLESQKLVSDIYYEGLYGHPKADNLAFEFVQLAAMNRDRESMARLGRMYLDGEGVHKDEASARYWLEKAANAEEPSACDALGMLILKDKENPEAIHEARSWFEKAEKAGIETASRHVRMADLLAARIDSKNFK